MKTEIRISPSLFSYDVVIEENLLLSTQVLKKYCAPLSSRFALITDSTIRPLYAERLAQVLQSLGFFVEILSFPPGEKQKTRQTKEWLEDQMLEAGLGKDSCVIALGGGVVSDIAGFVSATYCRGIPWLIMPTSLLAMVDASIGGKCGVNTPFGKNLVGSLYHPKAVLIDLSVLQTLPLSEYKMGIVEMIKHGLIMDEEYFTFFEKNTKKLLQKEGETLKQAIYQSVRSKASIVEESEKRDLLNFGHTVAHALETVSQNLLSHGQAVAMGMIAESYMSTKGKLSKESLERIVQIFHDYEIDIFYKHPYCVEKLLLAMTYDKKSVAQVPRFVMIEEMGKSLAIQGTYCTWVDKEIVTEALNWMFITLENRAFAMKE